MKRTFITELADEWDEKYEVKCEIEYYVGNLKAEDDGVEFDILSAQVKGRAVELTPRQQEDVTLNFWTAYFDGNL
jgi:hypothetical protein